MTLFGRPWAVERKTQSYDADGILQNGTPTSVTFSGTVQPADQNTLKVMASGRENDGSLMIFSDPRLQISEQSTNKGGDILTFDGVKYELTREQSYQNSLLPHYKYLAERRQ